MCPSNKTGMGTRAPEENREPVMAMKVASSAIKRHKKTVGTCAHRV